MYLKSYIHEERYSKHRTTRKIKVILTTWSQNEIVFVNAGKNTSDYSIFKFLNCKQEMTT